MTTPEKIEKLKENQIFVFGSNLKGEHHGGAAKQAKESFGALDGVGEGITGQSYAFPTLNGDRTQVSKESLIASKEKLYKYAEENKDKEFLVTKVGCGIAGFSEEEMKEVFKGDKPANIVLPKGWSIVRGYKAFDKGLTCRGFQYELGKDFFHEGDIEICSQGFHFCKSLGDVYSYYSYGSDIVVGEIETEGDVIDEDDKNKSVTNHIRIISLLNAEEASNNNGRDNTGHSNTGHSNTGYRNTGDRNTGHSNTGYRNTGHSNTGYRNTGHSNTGYSNTGDRNTGDWNTGDRNTGYSNTGDRNTGDWNTGDRNTGDWNTGDRNTGYFNFLSPETVLVFEKECKYEDWCNADKPMFIYFDTKQWIDFSDMTDKEKADYPSCKTCGGYLKTLDYKEAFTASYERASQSDKDKIKKLPNFDAEIFFKISGIRV